MEQNNFSDIVNKICGSVTGKQRREEVAEELMCHLEDTYERNLAMGKSEENAEADAVAALGDLDVLRERLGAVHSFSHAAAASSALNLFIFAFLLLKINLDIFGFKPIITFAANALLIFALMRLKTANKKLNIAFYAQTVSFVLSAAHSCFLYYAPSDIENYVYIVLIALVNIVMWYCSFSGLYGLYEKFCPDTKKKPHLIAPAVLLPLGQFAGSALVLLNDGKDFNIDGFILPIAIIIFYIFTAVQLARLKKSLWDADAEYGISPWHKAPVAAVCMAVAFCIIFPVFFMYSAATRVPEKTQLVIHDTENEAEAREIRKNMIALGFPEELMDELPDSEIMNYEGALHMEMQEMPGDEYIIQLYNFYFAVPVDEITDYRQRSLLRIEMLQGNDYYRCGVFHQYYQWGGHLTPFVGIDSFISVQQKSGDKIYVQKPLANNIDSHARYNEASGFEFRFEENQTVYFALTVGISRPYEYFSAEQAFHLIRQKMPFVYKHNTITDYAQSIAANSGELFADDSDYFMTREFFREGLFSPEFVGLMWDEEQQIYIHAEN